MISLNMAVVQKQVPERHGVLVAWRDGSAQADPGNGWGFVRVGAARAHPYLGSSSDLPAVGELGLVATIDKEVQVWLCSLHWQNENALVPGTSFWHHDSGACIQINQIGEFQIDLPSGLQIRQTTNDLPWPLPGGSSQATAGGNSGLPLTLSHPSGLSVQISPFGDLSINDATSISASSAGPVAVTSFGAVSITTLPMAQDPSQAVDQDSAEQIPPPLPPVVDITINGAGAVALVAQGDVSVQAQGNANIQAAGNVKVWGQAVTLMQGSIQFVMQPFKDWLTTWLGTHTHSGITSGVGASGPPVVPPVAPAGSLSGSTLTGPVSPS